jgi:hypothetical protein
MRGLEATIEGSQMPAEKTRVQPLSSSLKWAQRWSARLGKGMGSRRCSFWKMSLVEEATHAATERPLSYTWHGESKSTVGTARMEMARGTASGTRWRE